MDKFGRNYLLSVGLHDGGTLTIEPPFTVEFDITRNALSSANISSIRVFNLSEKNRNQIRKNNFDYGDLRLIQLRAGYGDNLPVVFEGNISQAWSVREGVDFITQIESFDGGYAFATATVNETFPSGTPNATIIDNLIGGLPGVERGAIGNYPGAISRGNSYSGSTVGILADLTGGGFFVDNGKANCLNDNECLVGELQVINSASGLLGTPVREQTILNFDILFEPRLIIGQQIELDSITGANFNGVYKIISIKHKGVISGVVSGNAITSVGLFYGTETLALVGN